MWPNVATSRISDVLQQLSAVYDTVCDRHQKGIAGRQWLRVPSLTE